MYAKLALRNVKRSLGDYTIYFLTLVLSISLIFAYNSLLFSDAIASFSSLMRPMMSILICVTVIVVLILGWLIAYITHFIFEQRSREFACYMTMGMERKTMSRLFMMEQLAIGGAALGIGIVLGNFFYFILSQVIFRMFDRSYYMELSFQLPAICLTVLCFAVMFAFSLFRQNQILRKIRMKELMNYERRNENLSKNSGKMVKGRLAFAVMLGILGIACIGIAFFMNFDFMGGYGNLFLLGAGILMQGASLMFFYRTLAEFVLKKYQKNEKRRLHHLNIFFYRQLTGRLKTNGKQLGVISILLLLTFMGLGGAAFMANAYQDALAKATAFDIQAVELYGSLDTKTCREFVNRHSRVTQDLDYVIYRLRDTQLIAEILKKVQPSVKGFEEMAEEQNKDCAIRLSDYNALRKMLGKEPVSLSSDEYIIQTEEAYYADQFQERPKHLVTEGREYRLKAVETGAFSQQMINTSGTNTSSILVLPDEVLDNLPITRQCYTAMVEDREKTNYQKEMVNVLEGYADHDGPSFISVNTYADQKTELQAIYMMTAFICCYAAFICIFICATILAVQLLNSSKKYRYQYEQLQRMGTEDREIGRLIWKQTAVYFGVPILFPLFLMLLYLIGIGAAFPVTRGMLLRSFLGANGVFLAIYGCYLTLTCLQYQKNV